MAIYRGNNLRRGLTITMVINHLQVLGWSCTKNPMFDTYPVILKILGSGAPHLVGKYIIRGNHYSSPNHRVDTVSVLQTIQLFTIRPLFLLLPFLKLTASKRNWKMMVGRLYPFIKLSAPRKSRPSILSFWAPFLESGPCPKNLPRWQPQLEEWFHWT